MASLRNTEYYQTSERMGSNLASDVEPNNDVVTSSYLQMQMDMVRETERDEDDEEDDDLKAKRKKKK